MGFWGRIFGSTSAPAAKPAGVKAPLSSAKKLQKFAVKSAESTGAKNTWAGSSDELNRDYAVATSAVIAKSQDLDVNNPEMRGFHRQRTAQAIGKGLAYKCAFRGAEVGLSDPDAHALALRINRLREIHSNMGGFDATGAGETEAKKQERALLTALVTGTCLIHKVWKTGRDRLLPLAIELIPGSRIETPPFKQGDVKVSYGFEYSDERRSEIVAAWVRKPARTVGGGGLVFDYTESSYLRIPIEDFAMIRLTEQAGIDRAMPICVALAQTLRVKNDFAEKILKCAHVQASDAVTIEVEAGANAWTRADDDAETGTNVSDADGLNVPFVEVDGVRYLYLNPGEKRSGVGVQLPQPDLPGFWDIMNSRCAAGVNASKSRWTRNVDNSYSAGSREDQQDFPVIDQLRESFFIAWEKVHGWFMDACVLSGQIQLADYATKRHFWVQSRVTPPREMHLNPVDARNAQRIGLALGIVSPQIVCESEGYDYEDIQYARAEAMVINRRIENEKGLPHGSLDSAKDLPDAITSTSVERDNAQGVGTVRDSKPGMSRTRFKVSRLSGRQHAIAG